MIKKILCPVDFSEATEFALRPAVSLATEFGAELVLAHVLDYPYPRVGPIVQGFDFEVYYAAMEEEAMRQLNDLVDEETREFAPTRSVVRRGTIFKEIVDLAGDEAVDLIVLPTHGRTGLDHMIWGSVAEKVLRLAPCPVMTVSPRQKEPLPMGGERVLFATDFSKSAEQALPSAVSIAKQYGAELLMVHVVTVWDYDPANPEWRFPPIPPEYRQSIEAAGKEELDRAGERLDDENIEVRTMLVRGFDPGLEIVRTAEAEGASLIVMATHGRTGLSHLVVGSTAEKVVRFAACPVLTIRQPAASLALDDELRVAS